MYSQRPFEWYMTRLPKLSISWQWGKQYTSPLTLGGRHNLFNYADRGEPYFISCYWFWNLDENVCHIPEHVNLLCEFCLNLNPIIKTLLFFTYSSFANWVVRYYFGLRDRTFFRVILLLTWGKLSRVPVAVHLALKIFMRVV